MHAQTMLRVECKLRTNPKYERDEYSDLFIDLFADSNCARSSVVFIWLGTSLYIFFFHSIPEIISCFVGARLSLDSILLNFY